MKGKRKRNSISVGHCLSCPSPVFLPPFIPFSSLIWSNASTFYLHKFEICVSPELQISSHYSETTDQNTEAGRKRDRERLCEYNRLRKQISHDNIFCLLQTPYWFGVSLLIRNAKRQMGPHKDECGVCTFTNRLARVLAVRAHTSHLLITT